MKLCIKCEKELPSDLFDYNRNVCKVCRYSKRKEGLEFRKEENLNRVQYIEQKKCSSCLDTKAHELFNIRRVSKDGLASECRECYNKNRNKEKSSASVKSAPTTKYCSVCNTLHPITQFKKTLKSKDGYYNICINCWKPTEWNSDKQKASGKRWCERNKEKVRIKLKNRSQKQQFIIKQRLSARIKCAFKLQSSRKIDKTYDYIGCSYEFLKKWFEFQFQDRMSWTTIGEWHIDHVTPCDMYNLTDEAQSYECFNWRNLRPCWADENLTKSSHIIPELIEKQKEIAKNFLEHTTTNLS